MSEPTREQPAVSPTLSTRSPWHISRIPAHLGRARTSTVVLSVLFVAIFALYLDVKPNAPATAPSGTSNPAPVVTTTAPVPQPTKAPSTAGTTQQQPTTTGTKGTTPTTTAAPTPTTTAPTSTSSSGPTTSTPTPTTPSLSSPTG